MKTAFHPNLAHFGVYCRDLEAMVTFYRNALGLVETDRGVGRTFPMTIVFLSATPEQHHQLALANGRPEGASSTVMQLSFKVAEIDHLREARRRALENGATRMRGLSHGNALSIYFDDPEQNLVEVYLDTPWYVAQPHGDPLDLEKSDEEIWAETERVCRADPTFMPLEAWKAQFGK